MKTNKLTLIFVSVLFSAVGIFSGCSQKKQAAASYNRIVCLSPSGFEILYALDASDLIVSRTDYCDYPAEGSSIPSVGGFDGSTLSAETMLEYSPDFVYGSRGIHDLIASQLEQFGITVYLSNPETIEDVFSEIEYIASVTNRTEKGLEVSAELRKKLEEISADSKTEKKRVFYELWNSPYTTVGKTSFMNDVLEKAGGENIFKDIDDPYPIVSEEAIVAKNPQLIIISAMNGISVEEICSRPAWKNIEAVKSGSVYLVDADLFTRPGPRVINAVGELSRLLGNN